MPTSQKKALNSSPPYAVPSLAIKKAPRFFVFGTEPCGVEANHNRKMKEYNEEYTLLDGRKKKTTERIHIGSLIWERLKQDGRKVTWLADEISCTRPHLYKIFAKANVDCELLMRISIALDFDFFQYYSAVVTAHINKRAGGEKA